MNRLVRYKIFKDEGIKNSVIVPLGPCKIKFNDSDIGNTLKSESTTLKIVPITEEIKTDESSEAKEEIELGRKITLETSLLFSNEMMTTLGINDTLSSLLKKGNFKDRNIRWNSIYRTLQCEYNNRTWIYFQIR